MDDRTDDSSAGTHVSEAPARQIVAEACQGPLVSLPAVPIGGPAGEGVLVRLLPERLAMRDIEDVEGFVRAQLRASNVHTRDAEEHEELVAHGLAIMAKLSKFYEEHREGYDEAGTFSGFAAYFLPKRLGDAWHKNHPEHHRVQDPETGQRSYRYGDAAVSLNGALEADPDWEPQDPRPGPGETTPGGWNVPVLEPPDYDPLLLQLRQALLNDFEKEIAIALDVVILRTHHDQSIEEIAAEMEIPPSAVRSALDRLQRVTFSLAAP